MRVVIQRVKRASVTIRGILKSEIDQGLLVFVGIGEQDNNNDVEWLCNKIIQLRIFDDNEGIMNLSIAEKGGSIMSVSQFTLHAKTKKGNRPSYINAASKETAIPLYNYFNETLAKLSGKNIATGEFGEMMDVELINDGPVTILIDTRIKE